MNFKLNRVTKIGILVFITLSVFIWGLNFLKGRDLLSTEKVYFARYQNVKGLSTSADVTLNGFKVGYVRSIYFAEDLSGDLIVKIAMNNDIKLRKNTEAQIVSLDVLGTKAIRINQGLENHYYESRDTLKSSVQPDLLQEINDQILPLKEKVENLVSTANSILGKVDEVLDDKTKKDIKESAHNLNELLASLGKTSQNLNHFLSENQSNLNSSIKNFKTFSDTIAQYSGSAGSSLANLSQLTDSLANSNIKSSIDQIQQILQKVNNKEGSLGKLVGDDALYNQLTLASKNLDNLLVDLRRNPSRYISLSAIKTGRTNYFISPENIDSKENISFKILLGKNIEINDFDQTLFGPIQQIIKKSDTLYYSRKIINFEDVYLLYQQAQDRHTNPEIKGYINDKEVNPTKAIRKIEK